MGKKPHYTNKNQINKKVLKKKIILPNTQSFKVDINKNESFRKKKFNSNLQKKVSQKHKKKLLKISTLEDLSSQKKNSLGDQRKIFKNGSLNHINQKQSIKKTGFKKNIKKSSPLERKKNYSYGKNKDYNNTFSSLKKKVFFKHNLKKKQFNLLLKFKKHSQNKKKIKPYKNFFELSFADEIIKKRFPISFPLLKFFPSVSTKYKLYRYRYGRNKKKLYQLARKKFIYRSALIKFVNAPIRRRKRKNRWKNRMILRWLYWNNSKQKFFKKLKILQKTFMQYYGNMSFYNFKRVHLWYSLYNNLTKFEKFFNYFEFRLPTIVVRIKFVRNYYQAVKFVNFGGISVNGLQISYTNFVTTVFDLIELAYRFYRYGYSKKYIKFKEYWRRVRRRAHYLRYFTKKYLKKITRWFLKKRSNYRGKKRTYFKYRSNRFFEKNRRIVSVILLRSLYKYKHRKFNKYFNFRNLSLLMSFIKK
jgi:ribosomal protein S4